MNRNVTVLEVAWVLSVVVVFGLLGFAVDAAGLWGSGAVVLAAAAVSITGVVLLQRRRRT